MDDLVKKITSNKNMSSEDIRKIFKNEGKKVGDALQREYKKIVQERKNYKNGSRRRRGHNKS